jgi:methanogenic corrinoid protein MtbC1
MRKDSNHRLYGIDDLKKILRISYLYNEGYKISRIAEMSEEEIRKQALEYSPKGSYDVFINQLMESSIDFDDLAFRNAMDVVLLHLNLEKAMTLVIYPFFNKLGMLWVTGNIIPAQEHFATNIIRNKIILATSQLKPKKIVANMKYLIFCPVGEFHEIPVLFVQYSLRLRGIQSVYFGVNTDMGQIHDFLEKNEATHLFLHLITNFTHLESGLLVEDLSRHFPKLKILASGRAFKDIQVENQNTTIFDTVQDFIAYLDHKEQDR